MENISKTKLKIKAIEDIEFYINPLLDTIDWKNKANIWNISIDITRNSTVDQQGKKVDRLDIFSGIKFSTPDFSDLLASVDLTTKIETKALDLSDIDQAFWEFLMETALDHCRGVFAFKCSNTLLQEKIMPTNTSQKIKNEFLKKINDIWG